MLSDQTAKNISTQFSQLGVYEQEKDRKEILEYIITKIEIEELFHNIKKSNIEDLVSKTLISGAGMIKLQILEHKYGAIRLHIFDPNYQNSELFHNVEGEPHIHDFQGISKVLLGQIKEDGYKVYSPNQNETKQYQFFVDWVKNLPISTQGAILYDLEKQKITHNKVLNFISYNNISERTLTELYYLYDSIKYKTGNEIFETFNSIGIFGLESDGTRIINVGESYFLPADRGHKITNCLNTITLFVNDKTYKSKGFAKDSNIVLRGHGKKFPRLQKHQIKRSLSVDQEAVSNLYSSINSVDF